MFLFFFLGWKEKSWTRVSCLCAQLVCITNKDYSDFLIPGCSSQHPKFTLLLLCSSERECVWTLESTCEWVSKTCCIKHFKCSKGVEKSIYLSNLLCQSLNSNQFSFNPQPRTQLPIRLFICHLCLCCTPSLPVHLSTFLLVSNSNPADYLAADTILQSPIYFRLHILHILCAPSCTLTHCMFQSKRCQIKLTC